MNSISFGKDRFHLNGEMETWCRRNIGPGGWTYSRPKTWEGMNDKIWLIDSMFGETTFTFKHEQDLMLFSLKWA